MATLPERFAPFLEHARYLSRGAFLFTWALFPATPFGETAPFYSILAELIFWMSLATFTLLHHRELIDNLIIYLAAIIIPIGLSFVPGMPGEFLIDRIPMFFVLSNVVAEERAKLRRDQRLRTRENSTDGSHEPETRDVNSTGSMNLTTSGTQSGAGETRGPSCPDLTSVLLSFTDGRERQAQLPQDAHSTDISLSQDGRSRPPSRWGSEIVAFWATSTPAPTSQEEDVWKADVTGSQTDPQPL